VPSAKPVTYTALCCKARRTSARRVILLHRDFGDFASPRRQELVDEGFRGALIRSLGELRRCVTVRAMGGGLIDSPQRRGRFHIAPNTISRTRCSTTLGFRLDSSKSRFSRRLSRKISRLSRTGAWLMTSMPEPNGLIAAPVLRIETRPMCKRQHLSADEPTRHAINTEDPPNLGPVHALRYVGVTATTLRERLHGSRHCG